MHKFPFKVIRGNLSEGRCSLVREARNCRACGEVVSSAVLLGAKLQDLGQVDYGEATLAPSRGQVWPFCG